MNIQQEKEKSLIGMVLQRPAAFSDVARQVGLSDFTDPQAQRTWASLLMLEERGLFPNIQGLMTVSRESGIDDQQRSSDLSYWLDAQRSTSSTANIFPMAESVAEDARCRRIRAFLQDLYQRSEKDCMSSDQMLAEADAQLLSLGAQHAEKEAVLLSEPMADNVRLIRQHIASGNTLTGIPTGFAQLDEATLGLQPSDLIILAARPACGKTTMALSLLINMAQRGTPVALFSIEMGARQIAMKAISNLCRIGGYKLRKGYLREEELERIEQSAIAQGASGQQAELPFYLSDSPTMTLADIRRQTRKLVKLHGVRCICIDYLQLISGGERTGRYYNRELEVAQISRGLKAIAKELDIVVIALAQMNRAVEQRRQDGGRPQLSDLRESGAIEQDADIVGFLHKRDLSSWMDEEQLQRAADADLPSITTLIIAKHRNGLCCDIDFRFRGEYSLFEEHNTTKNN